VLNIQVGRVVHSRVYQYIVILLNVFPEVVCYCIFMSYLVNWVGGGCTSVNSAELAKISFAEAESLVRPCVMISLRMNLLWIHFVYGVLPLHFRRKLCFRRHNMDCHFTYLTAKYIRDKLSIFLTWFSSC
jgi:hypothetical protein